MLSPAIFPGVQSLVDLAGSIVPAKGEGGGVIREFMQAGAAGDLAAAHQLTLGLDTEELSGFILGNSLLFKG